LSRDSKQRVQGGFRLPKVELKVGVEEAFMDALRGEDNEKRARGWYRDLTEDGPATKDGKDHQALGVVPTLRLTDI